jgi:hypothetical protein
MKKTIFVTLGLTFLIALPSFAQLARVWTEFQYYSVDLQNYLKSSLNETLSPLGMPTQTAIIRATGVVNLPNPIDVGKMLRQALVFNSKSDNFENNSAVRSQLMSNQVNRLITLGSINSNLGVNGQIRLKNKLQNTEISLKNIDTYSQKSDKLMNELEQLVSSVSGMANIPPFLSAKLNTNQADLQRQNIKIQTEQAKIIGETLAQNIQINQSLQYSNLNLANISQQVEESNRDRRLDIATESARLLRTATQIDLLGRQTANQTSEENQFLQTPNND